MKKVNLLLIALASVMAFSSCNSNKKTETENETETIQTIVTVDKLLTNAEQELDNVVLVEGVCTHICSHGGKKLFLMGDDDSKTIRVEASDDIGAFKPESVNSIVKVKGTLKEERIDEAYLTQWEARLAEGVVDEHGEDGEGCETELKAQGQEELDSETARIKDFREKIAVRNETEGKNYLSFYYVEAIEYTIL
ncbi:MAG TPA: hypothetical protein GX746_05935 [Bacteroidales bacterium]|nr:hypothetical protein [Bacteroidales bacterium]